MSVLQDLLSKMESWDDDLEDLIPPIGIVTENQELQKLLQNSKVKQILAWMQEDPLLIEPTLRFVDLKRALIVKSKLDVLYTPEEQEALRQRMEAADATSSSATVQ